MKNFILSFCLCISGVMSAQIITIPNANFKNALVNDFCIDTNNDGVLDANVDTNNDGEVQVSEALAVTNLNVSGQGISSFAGISYFSNLTHLNCRSNSMFDLDVSGLSNLNELDCSHSALSVLIVSGLINLNKLDCSLNSLINLDLSGLTNLQSLNYSSCLLTNLDLSGLTNLHSLKCSSNQLTTLDISTLINLNDLDCSNNQLTTLNLSSLSNLTTLNCYRNQLTALDVSGLTNLDSLNCEQNQLTTLNVSGLANLNNLNCSDNQLTTISLSGLTSLTVLNCGTNILAALNLSGLSNLNSLDCRSNQLTTLDVLAQTGLIDLNCDGNHLTTLNLSGQANLKSLFCFYNQLTALDLSTLPQLNNLDCGGNPLTTLDLSANTDLIWLSCSSCQLTTLDVSGCPNLNLLDCEQNQLTALNISGLINLNILTCAINQLTTLDVSESINLSSFQCQHNQLSSLFIKNGVSEVIDFSENPNLEFICCDASQIQAIRNAANNNGLSNCAVSSYCGIIPGGNFSTIQGSATFDFNNNGCDALDSSYYQFTINITDGINTGTLIADNNGYFAIPVQAGNYTLTPIIPTPNYFTITPSTAQITIPDTSNNTLAPFCITPNGIHHDLEVTILPTTPARPGFAASYSLVYKNNGNQVESGSVSFSFDDVLLDFLNASTAPNTTSTGVLTWSFSNLLPFQSESISLTFNCNTPTETPPLNAGDTLYFTSTIAGTQADETPLDNTFDLAQVVVGSYDPNDKTCLEGDIITPEMVGDYVHYMIRFENTGTYAAENVAVTDIIEVSRFDISSLQITASSHSMKTRISNGNEVEFIFENINLPFDDANNDGYVAFKIKTLATLQLNDTLKNQANIYFDYNAPITTNEAQTVVQLPNGSVSLGFNSNSSTLNLFPNPAESILYIPADVQITQADIFDMKGALVRSVSVRSNQIEVQGLSSGTYFTRLYSDAKLYSAKFMVK